MLETEIISVSLFRYQGFRARFTALKHMGTIPVKLKQVPGLKFSKLMGSGKGNGFSINPNFGVYALICVWDKEDSAIDFFKSRLYQKLIKQSIEKWTLYLQAFQAHGFWDTKSPFHLFPKIKDDDPIAVITRARIKPKFLFQFWKNVPKVSRSTDTAKGRIFSVGIGELPLVMQATFSIWENMTVMHDYAYKNQYHKEVVEKTRKLGWYSEELFARFRILKSEGKWNGKNPLKDLL